MADEARELALVEKLELRIALAKDDAKLQTLLQTFLPALLLKLTSPHARVRNKTVAVCQHINARVEAPGLRLLPIPLIEQLQEHGTQSSLLRHFNIRYLRLALVRLTPDDKEGVLKALMVDIHRHVLPASAVGSYLFYFFLSILVDYKLPRRGQNDVSVWRDTLNLRDVDAEGLSTWFAKLMLLSTKAISAAEVVPYPGLSKADVEFLAVTELPDAWTTSNPLAMNLNRAKALALDFAETSAFTDRERLRPFMSAVAHINPAGIADRGKSYTRIASSVEMDDRQLIRELYQTYIGIDGDDQLKVPAAPISLRTRVLTLLNKSTISASAFPDLLTVVLGQGLVDASDGLQAEKFNAAFVDFVVHTFRAAGHLQSEPLGRSLAGTMKDFLESSQGWPTANPGVDIVLRGKLYQLIGLAANEGRMLDLNLLEFLLHSLNEDTSGGETSISIEEALSSMAIAFSRSKLEPADEIAIEDILLRFFSVKKSHKSLNFVISRFANRCLPYSNAVARSINIRIIGTPGRTFEAAEECRKGLDPLWFKTTNSHRPDLWMRDYTPPMATDKGKFAFADFSLLMKQFFPSLDSTDDLDASSKALVSEINNYAQSVPDSFALLVKYAFRMLVVNILEVNDFSTITESWERSMDVLITTDNAKRVEMHNKLSQLSRQNNTFMAILALMLCALRLFGLKKTVEVLDCQEIFVQLLIVIPPWLRQQFATEFGLEGIVAALGSSERSTRDLAARSFSILVADDNALESMTPILSALLNSSKQWNTGFGEASNKAYGAINALARTLARSSHKTDSMNELLLRLNEIMSAVISQSKDNDGRDSAYDAVSQFSIWLVYGSKVEFTLNASSDENKELGAKDMVRQIAIQAKKADERAISALGRFSIWLGQDSDQDVLQLIRTEIRACHEIRQTESQFAVGEALSCLAFGSSSSAIETDFDTIGTWPKGPDRPQLAAEVLSETLKGFKESKPSLQRASVIWLLSLIQFGGHHDIVQKHLTQCQRAFMSTLGNRDELVQEASARGLGLVYEKGDAALKNALVEDLVASFSETKPKMAGTVTEDTELFSEGILRTHDGSISTYKDILDLASEVGDPSLVYRFMSLAANNAIWTSRAAFGNFGLSTILSDSGHLSSNPKLYPALYRYQFDPNPNVQRSMKSLWQSLVKEPQKALDEHFDIIINELLRNILGREWRAREASCRAIADLVQDRKFEKYEKYMDEIWGSCSKVMDDIKGSVRTAARGLSLTLTNILVRSLETGETSKSTTGMLNYVIPFLLSTSGVEARAKDVQGWAVSTLLLIIKKSRGNVLESHVPTLLESIIGMFSSLEGEMVNYLHLNADKYNITTSQIDDMRLKATRQSPLMDAVEKLMDSPFKDEATPDKVIQVLEKSIRSSIGMPSQTATSRILVSMFVRHHARYKPHADRFLRAIQKPLLDINDTVASSYAYAAGYLARWATSEQVQKSAEFAWNLWETSENDRHRAVAAEMLAAFAKHAPERFASLSETMMPYIFIGKHDDQEDVCETLKHTWSESTSGPRAVLLHLDAIVALATALLDAPRWTLKHAGARAISEICQTVASLDKAVSPAHAPKVWPALVKAIGGKSWEGKEVVLKAFGAFVDGVRAFWEQDPKVADEMTKIILREARRQNRGYQAHAFPVLGTYAAARTDLDLTTAILDIVSPVVEDLVTKADDMDVDGAKEEKIKDSLRDDLCTGAILATSQSFTAKAIADKEFASNFVAFLKLTQQANSLHSRKIAIQSFEALESVFKNALKDAMPARASLFANEKQRDTMVTNLKSVLHQPQYSSYGADTKLKRAKALTAIASYSELRSVLSDTISEEIANEPADAVKEELKRARSALQQ